MVDLWPEQGFGAVDETPVSIVKEQAALLGKHTGNLVLGEVRTRMENLKVNLQFRLVTPALDNYTFVLFELGYPVTTTFPISVGSAAWTPTVTKIRNTDELRDFLRSAFSAEDTTKTIRSLIAHSRLAS